MSNNLEEFLLEQWRQPEKKYAFLVSISVALLSISLGGLGFLSSALVMGASAVLGYLLVPLFRFVNDFAQKLDTNMDHLDELLVKAKAELQGIDKMKQQIEGAIEEVKSSLPEVKKTIEDVHETVQHANDGADMIGKIMTPVTGTVNLIGKAGAYLGWGKKESAAKEKVVPTKKPSKQQPIKSKPQRRSPRNKARF